MSGRLLGAIARADWQERRRSRSFWVALLLTAVLVTLLLPGTDAAYTTLEVGGWRGRYDAHSIGALLFSLAGVMVLMGGVMPLWRGESLAVDPLALLLPQLLLTGPLLAVVAALAMLFECVPGLRGGAGNVAWFFLWIAGLSSDVQGGPPSSGMHWLSDAMQAQVQRLDPAYTLGSMNIGISLIEPGASLQRFDFAGLLLSEALLVERALVLLGVLPILGVAGLFFRNFRERAGAGLPGLSKAPRSPALWLGRRLTMPRGCFRADPGGFARTLLGELRLLLRTLPGWLMLAVNVAALIVPISVVRVGRVPALLVRRLKLEQA